MARAVPGRFDPASRIERRGIPAAPLTDLYFNVLNGSWFKLIAFFAAAYVAANLIFAGLYYLGGDCLEGARPGSYLDAFYFSIQTISTIGYGAIYPKNAYAEAVVIVEAFSGLLGVAVMTGLVFAKFARPRVRVIFSNNVLLTRYDGRPALLFRATNARGNDIVEASMRVAVARNELTVEGHRLRRLHDLRLRREMTPLFILSWLAVHYIDEDSPLYGQSAEEMREESMLLIVTLTGMDGTFNQTIHARHTYRADDLLENHDFCDVILPSDDGRIIFDYNRFHDVRPSSTSTESASTMSS